MANDISILEKIDKVREKYLENALLEEEIQKKALEKLLEAERNIKAFYQKQTDVVLANQECMKKELAEYREMLESYSTFDSKVIGKILEKLVSFVEGDEYICQEATHYVSFCHEQFYLIVKGEKRQWYYEDLSSKTDKIQDIVNSGRGFILLKDYSSGQLIKFYACSDEEAKCLVDFGRFTYAKEFIDSVINFRIENKLKDISREELLLLFNKFIFDKKEIIQDNYEKNVLRVKGEKRASLYLRSSVK